ncbi:NAD(P)/FAD-dependent oxidoreductase [Flavobacterium sp. xlx-214]|uniref:NAD(P)-binding protein n=1 Tax=unclassified Flavobacterium TaxID=196869 RepID=UPI0013CF78D1|nr:MULTISPECIES: FAD/NAD(P)-binding protein [unclassified Flavobacterium]MBA5792961.1 NAD(P)/FAD-dependent oxidoreductase [Flavobacterium sp. xlx-221]QMI84706.1 NAD(P)/FAD-dependent oxidoreductase [Flavobacterium sp. xlx-214]
MKNGQKYNFSRRSFLKTIAAGFIASTFVQSCKQKAERLLFKVTGTNHILGHRLRTMDFPEPTETIHENIVIVGSGISGLSAARWLTLNNETNFKMLELETKMGGNAAFGEDKHSKYPIAAHYLPLPNENNDDLIDFLHQEKIISSFNKDQQPVYAEEHLCYDPHERLFIYNYWQEGLIPLFGLSSTDIDIFKQFDKHVVHFKEAKGIDGKFAFDIPLRKSSTDETFTKLDKLTFKDWLLQNNLNNQHLFNHLNYCSKDDYGIGIDKVSAWAGLHYFCARKNTNHQVLTWPEGNGFLMNLLGKYVKNKINYEQLVYRVEIINNKAVLFVYNQQVKKSYKIVANKAIMATPQFVNGYLFKERKQLTKNFQYAPWLTATLTVNKFPMGEGADLAWDNVIYNGFGLGYIYNQHQTLSSQPSIPFSITYYAALCEKNLITERKQLFSWSDEKWKTIVLNDLEKAHYKLSDEVSEIELHKKGHGMISPFPDFIFSEALTEARKPIANKIFFAHSDLSGISIFEEAFDQGINAAKQILNDTTLDT